MYCPRCATQNLDGAKFCRACGTNLETVAWALARQFESAELDQVISKKPKAGKNKLEKRREGLTQIVRASGLIGGSALVGAALAVFSNKPDWVIIWMVFAGWMACWGVMCLVAGLAALIESRFTPLQPTHIAGEASSRTTPLVSGEDQEILPAPRFPSSIAEHTTELLNPPSKPSS
ncbi:MAG TPA: zinc ribbon domain-containing protein [Pyrinomonadaceae bacterium]|nr:zinc ribbon domain-containing protein [Pyrinomonadaceae bacterium]